MISSIVSNSVVVIAVQGGRGGGGFATNAVGRPDASVVVRQTVCVQKRRGTEQRGRRGRNAAD